MMRTRVNAYSVSTAIDRIENNPFDNEVLLAARKSQDRTSTVRLHNNFLSRVSRDGYGLAPRQSAGYKFTAMMQGFFIGTLPNKESVPWLKNADTLSNRPKRCGAGAGIGILTVGGHVVCGGANCRRQ